MPSKGLQAVLLTGRACISTIAEKLWDICEYHSVRHYTFHRSSILFFLFCLEMLLFYDRIPEVFTPCTVEQSYISYVFQAIIVRDEK